MNATTTRRAILAGAAALPALALPAAATGADAELIELGRHLQALIPVYQQASAHHGEEACRVHDRIEARGPFPENLGTASDETREAYFAAMRAEWDAPAAAPAIASEREYVRHSTALDNLCSRIIHLKATTMQGLGVQALATAMMVETTGEWDTPANERDIDSKFYTALVENVLQAAGMELPFETA
jgi:hypothetical protein